MITKQGNLYVAEKGNFIVRKSDNFIMGEDIDLGLDDSLDNYEELPYTEEGYDAFYKLYSHKKHDKRSK